MRTELASLHEASASSAKIFYPVHTVRCVGPAVFRNQLSRDVGCLLDVDEAAISWSCLPGKFEHGSESCCPDLLVERSDGPAFVVVGPTEDRPIWLAEAVASAGKRLETYSRSELPATRLRNARDLLRYARYDVPLDDRVRLLAALDENGNLTVAECMPAFRGMPIAGLASLVLSRFIAIDLDEALIGPETIVRRVRP